MRHVHPREVQFYNAPNEREPFTEWFESIRDQTTQTRIQKRLVRLESGNYGDCHSVGEGVFEWGHGDEKTENFAGIPNGTTC